MVIDGLLITPEIIRNTKSAVLPKAMKKMVAACSEDLLDPTAVDSEYNRWQRKMDHYHIVHMIPAL